MNIHQPQLLFNRLLRTFLIPQLLSNTSAAILLFSKNLTSFGQLIYMPLLFHCWFPVHRKYRINVCYWTMSGLENISYLCIRSHTDLQSKEKFWRKHYIKFGGTVKESFDNGGVVLQKKACFRFYSFPLYSTISSTVSTIFLSVWPTLPSW